MTLEGTLYGLPLYITIQALGGNRQMLEEAARQSKTHIRIDLKGKPNYKRDLAVAFEDYFDRIDEETAKTITELLLNSVK